MNYAEIKKNDIANGEGVRTSLFVSGCRNRCKNCFNAVTWDFLYGKPFDQAVEDDIIASTRPRWISGLSLLGGEPFEPENQAPLLAFLRRFRTALPGKTVWCYTGFTLEELLGKSGGFFVFMVPVAEELDLKKAARACGEKAVEMLPQKELLPRTGYVHGGCSPIGMKKQFPTYIHQTAADYDTIFFSAGRVGAQVELPLSALQQALPVTPADIIKA